MCPFHGFYVEIHGAGFGIVADGGVPRVRQGTRLTGTKTSYVIFISTEVVSVIRSAIAELIDIRDWIVDIFHKKTYLSLKEQNCWLRTCHTISSDMMALG